MRQLFGNPCQASPDSGERAKNLVVSHERKGWGTENVLSPTFPVENMCTELQQNPGGQNLATVSHVRRREHSILDLESPWKQQEMLLTHPHCQLPGQYPTHSKCFIHDCLVDKPQSPRLLNMSLLSHHQAREAWQRCGLCMPETSHPQVKKGRLNLCCEEARGTAPAVLAAPGPTGTYGKANSGKTWRVFGGKVNLGAQSELIFAQDTLRARRVTRVQLTH